VTDIEIVIGKILSPRLSGDMAPQR